MMEFDDFIEAFNSQHIQLVKEDRENCTDLRDEKISLWLETQMLAAKAAYYNSESPIMTDQVFDKMESWLRLIKPESELLIKVGN